MRIFCKSIADIFDRQSTGGLRLCFGVIARGFVGNSSVRIRLQAIC